MMNNNINWCNPTMSREWALLTPEQKREQRFNWWLNPEGVRFVSPEAEKAYKARVQRLIDVYKVQEPDRVPVSFHIGSIPAFLYGIDYHTAMYDCERAVQAWTEFNNEYASKLDGFARLTSVIPARVYDLLDYKPYVWPGHGIPKSAAKVQFNEGEYMKADEYNALIRNPSDFWMRVYMPRIFGALESFRMCPPFTDIIEQPIDNLMSLTKPEVQATLQTLLDVGEELSKWKRVTSEFNRRLLESGFPMGMSSMAKAPFDTLGDTLRGTQGIMMDMYRQPDKLLDAMDVIADLTIDSAISRTNASRKAMVNFPLHKGADGWMSQKQFETFYWPSLKKVINALINEGILVSLFAEGGYNTRLESVNEFPKGAVHWRFDQTEMTRAKKILGDRCSIEGNVPASMLVAGTSQEVKEYCRRLIEVCGKGGGYILSPGAVSLDNAKLDNLRAMVQTAEEYGVYKK